jgi:hypothetical protein
MCKALVGKTEGRKPLGRPTRRCKDGIGMDLTLGTLDRGGGVEWIQLAQDRDQWQALVNKVMNLQILAPQS